MKNQYGDKAEMLLADTIVSKMKLKLKMFLNTSTKIKSYLTSVINQNFKNILIMEITYM